MVRVITDGACEGNPGPGGWAAIIVWEDGRLEELGGAEALTTNNRMELQAAIQGLRRLPPETPVEMVTDSTYLLKGITEWIHTWKRNGWRTSQKQPVENRDLWEELDRLAGRRATWQWTRGHAGHSLNERADRIAQSYAHRRSPGAQPAAERPAAPAAPRQAPLFAASSNTYLSLVGGVVQRHATWGDCEARVKGVSNARYKKCRSRQEELAALASWGLRPEDLPR